MVKVLVQTGKAVSLNEVARQIAYVIERRGYVVVLNRNIPQFISYNNLFHAVVFVYPVAPAWTIQWFYHYYKAKRELHGNVIYYTTVDGIPKKLSIPQWVYREVEFIANSQYSKRNLEKAGLKVLDVIPHGYLEVELSVASQLCERYRKLIQSNFRDRIIFGFVGDFNFRKGIENMLKAIEILSSKRKDFHVLLVTRKEILKYIEKIPNISLTSDFGVRSHVEIMAFYMSIDYLLLPSKCEGFGLPLLEANAVKTPAIITNIPPFREYADLKNNIVIDVKNVKLYDNQDGLLYELYDYDVNELVNAMENAIEIRKKYPSQYDEMKVKVYEKVKNMKSEILYDKLINHLKL